jgi:hypothetical protein
VSRGAVARPVTPGEVAARIAAEDGWFPGDVFAGQMESYRKADAVLVVGEVTCVPDDEDTGREGTRETAPEEISAVERERRMQHWFRHYVGREPTVRERTGAPVAGCAGCERLSGISACDDHARKIGEPMAWPPRDTWVPHVPGTNARPVPYNVLNSVK